jgi:hypothetical protein
VARARARLSQEVKLKALGLYTHPNPLEMPDGALVLADDVVIRREGVIEPRRGYSTYGTNTAVRLFDYSGTLLAHTAHSSGAIESDNGSGTFAALSGTFSAPDSTAAKMRGAQAAQNFYFTTSAGVYRMDSATATPQTAGAPVALSFERDPRVYTSSAGQAALASNVVTVTTTAAHSFYVGQVITQTSATEGTAFLTGNHTISTVPSSTSFTYAETAANATSALPHTYGPAELATANGFLADGYQVAYKFVINAADANNDLKRSTPSSRVVVANASGARGWATGEAKNVIVRCFIDNTFPDNWSIELYRTKQVATSTEPGEEYYKVYEAPIKNAETDARYVDITDVVPDALLLGETLYTSPSQEGDDGANYPPPLARDICAFNDSMFYARTTGPHRLTVSLLSVDSLADGNILTIASSTGPTGGTAFTFKTTPTSATHVKIETAGTVAQDIRNTCLNLVATINREGTYRAAYLSGENEAPGKFLIERKSLGAAAIGLFFSGTRTVFQPRANFGPTANFSLVRASNVVTATTAGVSNALVGEQLTLASPPAGFGAGPHLVLTTSGTTFTYAETAADNTPAGTHQFYLTYPAMSSDDAAPHRVYKSKSGQPEAVPLLNFDDLGSKDAELLRVAAMRGSIFAFKEDGLYRGNGEVGGWSLFDPTIILIAPDSVAALGNRLYAWTTQGVVSISDTGVEVVSRPIEKTLSALYVTDPTNVKAASFAIGYESEREYRLSTISASGETTATQTFVYNALTQAWTRDTTDATHGLVKSTDDKIYLQAATTVLKERKAYTYADYEDPILAVTIASLTATTATLSSASGVSVGDVLQQAENNVRITAINSNTLTVATEDLALLGTPNTLVGNVTAGAASIRKAIPAAVQWAPTTGGAPAELKLFRETNFLMGNCHAPLATVTTSSELVLTTEADSVDLLTIPAQWTAFVTTWGGTEKPHNIRRPIPQQHRRCARLSVKFACATTWNVWAINGLSIVFEAMSERTGK